MKQQTVHTIGRLAVTIPTGTVGIACDQITALSIAASSGVERVYADGRPAWVARAPWQPLLASQLSGLEVAVEAWAAHLVIVALPDTLLQRGRNELIEALVQTSGQGDEELAALIGEFRKAFRQALADKGFSLDESGPADLIVNKPGVRSTAYDYDHDRVIGLHIDNHQKMPLNERRRSYTLANLNIGWNDRFLDFIPHSVSSLLSLTGEGSDTAKLPRDIKDAFFTSLVDTPVIRVVIPPGTAYLLNTQNCIHDGATPPGEMPDVAFLMMGYPQ
ncbi:MAG: hypothetical protein P4N41_22570 [Negativicutes bacterium]|nr:hypothetical protein [Negativicutes bacterium]